MESKGKQMNFSKQIIIQAVRDVESGHSRREVCKKYGMAYGTLGEWLLKYGSQEYQDNKRAQFSIRQKRDIVKAVQEEKMTIQEACLVYKIKDPGTLKKWLRQAKKQDIPDISAGHIQPIDNQQEQLQKELAETKLKLLALETLIDVAEDKLKITIRKKPGAKQ